MSGIKIDSFDQLQDLVDTYGIENLECHGTPYFGGAFTGYIHLGRLTKKDQGYGYKSDVLPGLNISEGMCYWSKDGMAIKDLHVKPLIDLEVAGQMDLFGGAA